LVVVHRGGIVRELFHLPVDFVSPDVIIDELEEPDGHELEGLGLLRVEFAGERVLEAEDLWEHNLDVTVNDIFALVLAIHEGLHLLTGDRRLRILAEKHRVAVHGTLWILDEMVSQGILTPGQALMPCKACSTQAAGCLKLSAVLVF
jgi:predicted nucleic acid-binding protein